ncbi:MAG: c-type cytochrome, partial [Gemmatimonadaceae bacterium]
CVSCHQANGEGLPGSFPPLAGSEYAAAANTSVPINIVIRGMQGPLTVKGAQYNGLMPPYGLGIEMSDDEVAAVLTHVRSSWGNNASAITAQEVAAVRAQAAGKPPVTAEEVAPLL